MNCSVPGTMQTIVPGHFYASIDLLSISALTEVIQVSIAWVNINYCCSTAIPVTGISEKPFFSRIFFPDRSLKFVHFFRYQQGMTFICLPEGCPDLQ